jgi:hypothetical protein
MQKGKSFDEIHHLQEFGLVSGLGGNVTKLFPFDFDAPVRLTYCDRTLLLKAPWHSQIATQMVLLTSTGREIFGILRPTFEVENLKLALDHLPKERFQSIELVNQPVPGTHDVERMSVQTLWQQRDAAHPV